MTDFSGLPLVIEPADLQARLDSPELILVDLTSANRYGSGHIPGARFVDFKRTQLGQPPAPGLTPAKADLEKLFGELGHRADATYVVGASSSRTRSRAVTFRRNISPRSKRASAKPL